MFKVTYTDGTEVMTASEADALALFDAAEGRADAFALSDYGYWTMIADGWEWEQ